MVFHGSLSNSKSPQVYRSLLSILAVLNNVVVWMVSTCPLTLKSSNPLNNPLVILLKAPITIGTIITFMFHSLSNSLARSMYLSFFSHFFQFYSVVSWDSKVDNFANFLLSLIIMRSDFLVVIRYPCICQSPIGAYMYHFLGQVLVCASTIY